MPVCGSNVAFCDLPLRYDTYVGCSHGCQYCFVQKKNSDLNNISIAGGPERILNFINGKRNLKNNFIDWPLPIHWGGMSDPFQPAEKTFRKSYDCLKVFAETKYPVLFSTKGELIVDPEYLSVLRDCNAAAQISIVAPSYDNFEKGAPPFKRRIEMLEILSQFTKRTIARCQPLMLQYTDEVIETTIPLLADSGVYGITVEGLKSFGPTQYTNVKLLGDFVYPYRMIKESFDRIKEAAHQFGLVFWAAENRLRSMGDDLNCCGTNGIEGFEPNLCNLNHLYFGGYAVRPGHEKPGTAQAFGSVAQTGAAHQMLGQIPIARVMEEIAKVRTMRILMGVDMQNEQFEFGFSSPTDQLASHGDGENGLLW